MAEARSLKSREYGTDPLSHPTSNVVDYDRRVRYNNTTKSSVMHLEPDQVEAQRVVNQRDRYHGATPLTTEKTRTSYQDSNLFQNKDTNIGTVQPGAVVDPAEQRMRQTNTFHSSVFAGPADGNVNQRNQNTYNSSIFAPAQQNPCNRVRLGGYSQGTETLFGGDTTKYDQSSSNHMVRACAKKVEAQVAQTFNAYEAKAREIYGESATKYGMNASKRDGALMASNADWKNTQIDSTNQASPMKHCNVDQSKDRKDRKYQELTSDVFGTGAHANFNREAGQVKFGSNDGWMTQGGLAHPVNVGSTHINTYNRRQNELASQVLEQTDYRGYEPLNKATVDMNNFQHDHSHTAKGRKCDKDFKHTVSGQEPLRQNYDDYNAKGAKQSNLCSALDKPVPEVQQTQTNGTQQDEGGAYFVAGRETKATKQMFLASNNPATGETSLKGYDAAEMAAPEVIDWVVSGLPPSMEVPQLKKLAQVKHVIKATVDEDNFKGTCLGTGRIQIRLNHGETAENVRLNFLRRGFSVNDFVQDPRKKPTLTGPPKDYGGEVYNAAAKKQSFLATQTPQTFGNSGYYQVRN